LIVIILWPCIRDASLHVISAELSIPLRELSTSFLCKLVHAVTRGVDVGRPVGL
jgi:hypothetical protein